MSNILKDVYGLKDSEIRPLAEAMLMFLILRGVEAKKTDCFLTAKNICIALLEKADEENDRTRLHTKRKD